LITAQEVTGLNPVEVTTERTLQILYFAGFLDFIL